MEETGKPKGYSVLGCLTTVWQTGDPMAGLLDGQNPSDLDGHHLDPRFAWGFGSPDVTWRSQTLRN